MVNSLENIDKSKVYVDRIEGLDEVVEDVIGDTLVGAVSTITTSDLTASKILVSDTNGKVAASNKAITDIGGDGDNLSITKNASDKLQTVGVINQNNTSTALKSWSGTLAQYNAIVSKDSGTLYNITDDASGTMNVYNKAEVDTLLNNKANKSEVNLALNNKADINLSNISNNIDYVIETKQPTDSDLSWYRIYKSGWIEQGGRIAVNCTANIAAAWNANFPITMIDTNYNYSLALKSGWIYESLGGTEAYTTTYLSGFINTPHDQGVILTWEVKGQKA